MSTSLQHTAYTRALFVHAARKFFKAGRAQKVYDEQILIHKFSFGVSEATVEGSGNQLQQIHFKWHYTE